MARIFSKLFFGQKFGRVIFWPEFFQSFSSGGSPAPSATTLESAFGRTISRVVLHAGRPTTAPSLPDTFIVGLHHHRPPLRRRPRSVGRFVVSTGTKTTNRPLLPSSERTRGIYSSAPTRRSEPASFGTQSFIHRTRGPPNSYRPLIGPFHESSDSPSSLYIRESR